MKKSNKKFLVSLMSFALIAAGGAGFALTANVAQAEGNGIAVVEGASVRVAGRMIGEAEQVTPAIRFSVTVDESIVSAIGTTTEIGMIIVPEAYVAAYNEYKAEATEAKDYYDYFTTESKCISFVYDSQDYLATVDAKGKLVDPATTDEYTYVVRGAVDQVSVLTREYVAIAYTANLDGTNKVYAEATSLARSVAYVSSAAINANETADVLSTNVKKAAYEILGAEYEAQGQPLEDEAFDLAATESTLGIGDTLELATNNLKEFSVAYTSDNNCVTVDENGKVTAVSAGTATVTAKIGALYERTCEITVSAANPVIFDPTSANATEQFTNNQSLTPMVVTPESAYNGAYLKYAWTDTFTSNNHTGFMFANKDYSAYNTYEKVQIWLYLIPGTTDTSINIDFVGKTTPLAVNAWNMVELDVATFTTRVEAGSHICSINRRYIKQFYIGKITAVGTDMQDVVVFDPASANATTQWTNNRSLTPTAVAADGIYNGSYLKYSFAATASNSYLKLVSTNMDFSALEGYDKVQIWVYIVPTTTMRDIQMNLDFAGVGTMLQTYQWNLIEMDAQTFISRAQAGEHLFAPNMRYFTEFRIGTITAVKTA